MNQLVVDDDEDDVDDNDDTERHAHSVPIVRGLVLLYFHALRCTSKVFVLWVGPLHYTDNSTSLTFGFP